MSSDIKGAVSFCFNQNGFECVCIGGAEEKDFECVWMCEPMHVSCLACLSTIVRAKPFGLLSIIFADSLLCLSAFVKLEREIPQAD